MRKAYAICHEFAFYCLGESLKQERGPKKELIQDLIGTFASTSDLLSGKRSEKGTLNDECMKLIISSEFDEMKDEITELLGIHGFSEEQVLQGFLMRAGICENESLEISKKILHALRTLELPWLSDYHPSPESMKIAIN